MIQCFTAFKVFKLVIIYENKIETCVIVSEFIFVVKKHQRVVEGKSTPSDREILKQKMVIMQEQIEELKQIQEEFESLKNIVTELQG